MATWKPRVGERVRVRDGAAHDEMTESAEGEISEDSGESALGIKFDDMDGVHRWYVASELEPIESAQSARRQVSHMRRERFIIDGASWLAIDAAAVRAHGGYFDVREAPPAFATIDGVAVVSVCGPLANARHPWWDSYESIRERAGAALASKPKALVLALNTPGGAAQGNVETAKWIRDAAAKAGVPVVAFAEGMACSAGYALACAASRIVASPTSILGSIGCISERVDVSEALSRQGVRVEFITSGERKADGAAERAITPEEIAALRTTVGDFASYFFGWVSEARRAQFATPESVGALQAGIFLGERAKSVGLADEVASFETLIASLSGRAVVAHSTPSARGAKSRARNTETRSMDKARICKLLGLPEDASDEDVMKALEEKLGKKDEPEAEETKAMRARLAGMDAAISSLRSDLADRDAKLAKVEPILAAQAKRDREDAVFAAMRAKGMPTHAGKPGAEAPTERAAKFLDLAEKHGVESALAAIDASHVPPQGNPIAPPTVTVPAPSPEARAAADASSANVADSARAVELATAAVKAEQPSLSGPAFFTAVLARARKDHPAAFSRSAAKN